MNTSPTTSRRYQHRRRNAASGRFTPNHADLSERIFVRLRPEVAAALRRLVVTTGEGLSFAVDTLLGEQLRVGKSGTAAEQQESEPVFNNSATNGAQVFSDAIAGPTGAHAPTAVVRGEVSNAPLTLGDAGVRSGQQHSTEGYSRTSVAGVCNHCHQRHGRYRRCTDKA